MIPAFKKSASANRGKKSEDAVSKFLAAWADEDPRREFNRMVDTKAAGRIIKAAAADFEFFSNVRGPAFGLLEVKETEHDYRLARPKVPQLPGLRKRAKCGGICVVLIHHTTIKRWRAVDVDWLMTHGDKGSWNLTEVPLFMDARGALEQTLSEVFL